MEKKLSFLGIDRSPPLSPSVSSARNPAAKRNDGAAGWPRCCLVIWETWSGLVIGECGSVAEGSSASRRRRKRSVTAGRRGGVTKGRGCSPVVRSPFSASIFLLSFLVTRSVVHVVIQLSYRRIWKTNFSKNLSNLDDDLTIFPRRTNRYRYRSHINETFQLPRTSIYSKKSKCEKKSVLNSPLFSSLCPRHRQGKTKVEEERLIGNTTRR